jgi:DNA polymerase elongation subunit (family B)
VTITLIAPIWLHMYSKYENIKAAELVTRYGCYTIKQCIKIAEDMFGWTVIYGDTDSIFVSSNVSGNCHLKRLSVLHVLI